MSKKPTVLMILDGYGLNASVRQMPFVKGKRLSWIS